MSFARNFALGQQIAKTAMDTYEDARRKRDFQEVMDAKPEQSYTGADGQFLENIANAKDTQGNNVYQLDARQDGTYGLRVRGMDGNYTAVDGPAIAPSQTQFLGTTTQGKLTEPQIERMRYKALADRTARYDPKEALRMRRELGVMERDDQRFAQDTWRFGQEQERAQREAGEREIDDQIKKQSSEWWAKRLSNPDGTQRAPSTDDYMAAAQNRAYLLFQNGRQDQGVAAVRDYMQGAASQIQLQTAERNQALSRVAASAAAGDLTALKDFYNTYVPDGARVVDVRQDPKTKAVTVFRETTDGRQLPSSTLKDMGQVMAALNTFNDPMSLYKYTQDQFMNDLRTQELKQGERRLGLSERALNKPEWELFTDAKGNPVPVDMNSIPKGKDGVGALPAGLSKPTKPLTAAERAKAIESMVNAGWSKEQATILVDSRSGPAAAAPDSEDPDAALRKKDLSGGSFKPIPKTDVTKPGPAAYGNPKNFERRSERSLFGGQPTYYYFDPATGKRLSVDEYDRLMGGR